MSVIFKGGWNFFDFEIWNKVLLIGCKCCR